MENPPPTPFPRLFISAVSDEFGTLRREVASVVRQLGYLPVSMDDWSAGHGELRAWLRHEIDSCDGLIHIPGIAYGAEPESHDPASHGLSPDIHRYSYTQYEFLYAQSRGTTTWVIQPGSACTRDTPIDRLDLPKSHDIPDSAKYQTTRRELQSAWLQRLKEQNHLRHKPHDDKDLKLLLHNLRDHADELRQKFSLWQSRISLDLQSLSTTIAEGQRRQDAALQELKTTAVQLSKAASKIELQATKIKPSCLADNRQKMLQKVRDYWINGVLHQAVKEAHRFQIGHELVPTAVVTDHRMPDREFGPDDDIAELFDASGSRLLILGSPGGGKTMLLLRLAERLVQRAEADTTAPIPIVLNLSSWWRDRLPLDQWIIRETSNAYQIPTVVITRWVRDEAIIPLLDGLDEVGLGSSARQAWAEATNRDAAVSVEGDGIEGAAAKEARSACLRAINRFCHPDLSDPSSKSAFGVAVCSRTSEYQELTELLQLDGALMLQDLSDCQVHAVMSQDRMKGVRAIAEHEPWISVMSRNPFLLNVMSVAYSYANLTEKQSQAERQSHLMAEYVNHRLRESRDYREASLDATSIRHLLKWLAKNMTASGQTVFHIESLQMGWLSKLWARCAYCLLMRVATIGAGLAFAFVVLSLTTLLQAPNTKTMSLGAVIGLILVPTTLMIVPGSLAAAIEWRASVVLTNRRHGVTSSIAAALAMSLAATLLFFSAQAPFWMMPDFDRFYESWWSLAFCAAVFGSVVGPWSVLSALMANWLKIRRPTLVYNFSVLWFAILCPLLLLLFNEVEDWGIIIVLLTVGLAVPGSLIFGWIGTLLENEVQVAEKFEWRWNWLGLASGALPIWAFAGVSAVSEYGKSASGPTTLFIFSWGAVGILFGTVGAIVAGFGRVEQVYQRIQPNEGLLRSLRKTLQLALSFGAVGFTLAFVVSTLLFGGAVQDSFGWFAHLKFATGLGAIFLPIGAFVGGLEVPVKHYLLRCLLRFSDLVPLRLGDSLTSVCRVLLLRRVAGGFIFTHRYLLEHFAALAAKDAAR